MGTYLTKYLDHTAKIIKGETNRLPKPIPLKNSPSDLSNTMIQILKIVYGDKNVSRDVEINGHKFLAYSENLVFEIIGVSTQINEEKIKAALINHNVEIIYFVADGFSFQHPQLRYKYIGDYVNVVKNRNQSDIVRSINEFRNKTEDFYARFKKTQASTR